ncbi:MAG: ferrous iron transport protein A [Flavobacteriales bacterium]|nr:ferrous iron transport protein A [Flavobacteriales bacterium]
MTLDQLAIGDRALIKSYSEEDVALKLMELGMIPNELVTMIRKAPAGDPVAIKIGNSVLALRVDEASAVGIEKIQ